MIWVGGVAPYPNNVRFAQMHECSRCNRTQYDHVGLVLWQEIRNSASELQ